MPTFDMPATGTWEQRGGWVVRALMRDFGLTIEQASGLVGNLGFESRGFESLQELAPAIEGTRGGYGWAQWTGSRRRAFEGWRQQHNLSAASDEANYGFLCEELRTTYKSVLAALKTRTSLADAVWLVGEKYETPDGTTSAYLPGYGDRLKWAERGLAGAKALTDAPAVPTPAPPDGESGVSREEDDDAVFRDVIASAIKTVQISLGKTGDYDGKVDGIWGQKSQTAITDFQRRQTTV